MNFEIKLALEESKLIAIQKYSDEILENYHTSSEVIGNYIT